MKTGAKILVYFFASIAAGVAVVFGAPALIVVWLAAKADIEGSILLILAICGVEMLWLYALGCVWYLL